MNRAINTLNSSTLSLETRQVTLIDWSRAQKLLGLSMPSFDTHPGKTSSG